MYWFFAIANIKLLFGIAKPFFMYHVQFLMIGSKESTEENLWFGV